MVGLDELMQDLKVEKELQGESERDEMVIQKERERERACYN